MASQNNEHAEVYSEAHGFPTAHVIGFVISIVMTFAALWLVLSRRLGPAALTASILGLAVLQIAVQLFFFMHINEGPRPRLHVTALALGLFFTFCVIAGSIWVMSFGGTLGY
jgi:cytochrome o ubiquinol oxidase operon protein cyoD